jgi:hypothetical protein
VNIFALEKFDDEGHLCCFYTVRWENSTLSETEKFFNKFQNIVLYRRSIQELAKFIDIIIGSEYGALEAFFRFENFAQALPPSGEYSFGELTINYGNFPLRLYCLRISNSLVILFNGGEKTSANAQGGKTSMVFFEANLFADRILKALHQKDIFITHDERTFKNYDGSEEIYL